MSELQISVENRKGLERAVSIQVPASRVDDEVALRLKKFARTARIKGFRPGKVPAKVIRQRYGDQVRSDVLQEVLQSSYQEAINKEKLRPAGAPRFEPEQLEAGEDLRFSAVFEVYPEIELADLSKLKIERPAVAIEEADVDRMIETLQRQRVNWEPVDRSSADGDRVRVDFSATLNGEPLEGGSGEDVAVVIGEGSMLPDFEKNLKGIAAGQGKEFKLKFPKDYHETRLAGEKAVFTVKIREVAEAHLPEVDTEFVKSFGVESGQLEDLRADVRRNMEREAGAKVVAEVKQQVMDGMLAANQVEVPSVLVEQEAANLQSDAMRQLGIQDISQAPPLDSFRQTAERRTRLGLLIGAFINENKIEVDKERVKEKVQEICAPYDQPDQIATMYYQNPSLLRSVESVVLEDQVIELIVERAHVKEKSMTFSQLLES